MADPAPLDVYLNDHLAGTGAAVELVGRIGHNNQGTAVATHMAEPARRHRGRPGHPGHGHAAGRGPQHAQARGREGAGDAEPLPAQRARDRQPWVTLLMELETLSLGIEGKVAPWRSLGGIGGTRPDLAEFDLPALASRGVSQRAGLERFRLEAAAAALA